VRQNGIRDLGLDFVPTKATEGTIFYDHMGRTFKVLAAGTKYYSMEALDGGHSGLYRIARNGWPEGMSPLTTVQDNPVEEQQ
jgi:hypothetical protein